MLAGVSLCPIFVLSIRCNLHFAFVYNAFIYIAFVYTAFVYNAFVYNAFIYNAFVYIALLCCLFMFWRKYSRCLGRFWLALQTY